MNLFNKSKLKEIYFKIYYKINIDYSCYSNFKSSINPNNQFLFNSKNLISPKENIMFNNSNIMSNASKNNKPLNNDFSLISTKIHLDKNNSLKDNLNKTKNCNKNYNNSLNNNIITELIAKNSKFEGHTGTISHIIQIKSKNGEKDFFKPNYKICTSSWDSTIKLWDFDSNKCLGTITGHIGAVYCIRQIRNFKKEEEIKCKLHKYYFKKLISCGFDATIRIWDLKTLKCLKIFQGHKNIIESIIQINDKIYSGSHDKEIKIWMLSSKKKYLENIDKTNKTLHMKKDKKESSDSETTDEEDSLSTKKTKEIIKNLNIDLDHYDNILNKSDKEKQLIKEYSNRYFSGNLSGHTDIIKCLQRIKLKKNKYFLVSGGHDRTIRVWNLKRNYCERILNGHEHCVNSIIKMKWKYDNYSIATASLDKTIKLWNLKNFECFFTINSAQEDSINKLIFLKWRNEDSVIISCGDDKTVKFWDIVYDNKKQNCFEAKCFKVLKNNENAAYVNALKQMKWGRDETTILTGGKDSEVTIWS